MYEFERHVDKLAAEILKAAAGDFLDELERIAELLANEDPAAIAAALKLALPDARPELLAGLQRALEYGLEYGGESLEKATDAATAEKAAKSKTVVTLTVSAASLAAIATLMATAAQRLKLTKAILRGDPEDLAAAFAPLLSVRNEFGRTISTTVAAESNKGIVATAKAAGREVVWVAEFDACRHCLAYSGQHVPAGEEFEHGLSFGEVGLKVVGKLDNCPLHPNCRCHLEILGHESFAEALQREARRSVLRGSSLESESMRQRLIAAELLLASKDSGMPKSVLKYARDAIEAGRFPNRKGNRPRAAA